ncbi:protein CutA homolog isoform X2 [Onychostoma macrolepis]|uniref:protein CutA homolog isoform X2 n=1 Tax=Onychostoma macrolepis TaxID=369639 RepID=UPI00272DA278|nr:protein CutA homolog isoform X2 [Onychostoma macrolepis]
MQENNPDFLYQRYSKDIMTSAVPRSGFVVFCVTLCVQIHSAVTGSYVAGYHSVLLVNCPTEQTARDIGRSIMEKRLAACVNIFPLTTTMYYWKGEIRDTSEILLLVRTRTSLVQRLVTYIKSARAAPSNPWLSDVLREHRTKLRAAERKWRKSNNPSDLSRTNWTLNSPANCKSPFQIISLLDLSAAFDTVNHQILLSTLSSLGIAGIPLRWFESYLTDDPTVAARISGCLADISAWMKEHHLQLNLAKTELLVFPPLQLYSMTSRSS